MKATFVILTCMVFMAAYALAEEEELEHFENR